MISTASGENAHALPRGPKLALPVRMRALAMIVVFTLTLPPPGARAESTIRLVPKTESKPSEPRPSESAPEQPPSVGRERTEPEDDEDEPERPQPSPAPPAEDLDLAPKLPPAALERVPAEVAAGRGKPPVMPLVGIGFSVVAGIVGTILLVEAGNNLDPDNFTIETEGEGEDLEVELSDRFIDAQNAVISNGIAGSILVSSATAGLLASILVLTTNGRR